MEKRFNAKIVYKMLPEHPDYKYVHDTDKELAFEDIYYLDNDYFFSEDSMEDYIRNDLLLIAGGGYDSEHIYDVKFKIY